MGSVKLSFLAVLYFSIVKSQKKKNKTNDLLLVTLEALDFTSSGIVFVCVSVCVSAFVVKGRKGERYVCRFGLQGLLGITQTVALTTFSFCMEAFDKGVVQMSL